MSAGSNNVVIQVTDGVDATIAPKIRDIGIAASNSASALTQLQTALNMVSTNGTKLNQTLASLTPNTNNATAGTSRLTGAIAQLAARVVGAELGLGMMGGALGRVGVAAGIALPLIVAALAVAAVVGAILAYEKYESQLEKIAEQQTKVAESTNGLNDNLLKQQETLIGLTQGSLAKYRQELLDLPLKSIKVELADLEKLWKEQDSIWATGLTRAGSGLQHILDLLISITSGGAKPLPAFDIGDATKFVQEQEKIRAEGQLTKEVSKNDAAETARDSAIYAQQRVQNNFNALQNEIANTRNKIRTETELYNKQSGDQQERTLQGIQVLQGYYQRDLIAFQAYQQEKAEIEKGASGELLAQQRKRAEEELRAFNEQINQLKQGSGVITPQQQLGVRQNQLSSFDAEHPGDKNQDSPFAQTRDTLVKDIGNLTQQIDRQNRSLDELLTKYQQEITASGAYSNALKIEAESRKVADEINRIAPGNPNGANTLANLKELIKTKVEEAGISREEAAIYKEFNEPLLQYNQAIEAANRLLAAHVITSTQAAIAVAAATRAREDALNPLNEYQIGLEHEVSLLGIYGTALKAATEVDRVRQGLQKEGRDLTQEQISALTKFLTLLEQQKKIQEDVNALYEQNAGAVEKLLIAQEALNVAKAKGIISETQYRIAVTQNNVALANQNLLESNHAKLLSQLISALGSYASSYKGLAKGLADAYGQAFQTIADGAANSLGRAIAYGENLGAAFKDVARQAVSELIAAFIKLGIQWIINEAIGTALASSLTAASAAAGAAVASAWAPAAAFVSLATIGLNAGPAAASISGTVALTQALAHVGQAFKDGGIVNGPGTGTSDEILALLSNGEYVVNAQATKQNRALLDQINGGASAVRSPIGATAVGGGVNVQVIHDGSTAIKIVPMDDGRIRIIAKQTAEQVVHEKASKVVASDFQNPNSHVSKAVQSNFAVTRKR